MKMNHTLAAAMLLGLVSGEYRNRPSITSGNRLHTERARPGSREELERLAAAEAKRARKAVRMRSQ